MVTYPFRASDFGKVFAHHHRLLSANNVAKLAVFVATVMGTTGVSSGECRPGPRFQSTRP